MRYAIEFDLPDNDILTKEIKTSHVYWQIWGYSGICRAKPVQTERKKGKWNFIGDNMFECNCCGTPYTTQQLNGLRNYDTDPYAPKFCPNCGADMRGEKDG